MRSHIKYDRLRCVQAVIKRIVLGHRGGQNVDPKRMECAHDKVSWICSSPIGLHDRFVTNWPMSKTSVLTSYSVVNPRFDEKVVEVLNPALCPARLQQDCPLAVCKIGPRNGNRDWQFWCHWYVQSGCILSMIWVSSMSWILLQARVICLKKINRPKDGHMMAYPSGRMN